MGNLFKKYKSKVINNGRKFLSAIDFFEMNLYKKELQNFNPLTNNSNNTTTGPTEQTILSEPFGQNGVSGLGLPYYNIPSSWTRSHTTIVGFDDPIEIPSCNLPDSSGGVLLVFSNSFIRQEYLTTLALSTIGKTNIKLNFNEYRGYLIGSPPPLTIEYSPNNGSTWFNVTWTETPLDLTWVNTGDINLPVGAENISQLKIRFGVLGDGSTEYVVLDDVKIKATF